MTPCLPLALIPDSFLAPVAIGFTVATACFALYWVVVAFGVLDHDVYDGSADSVAGITLHFFFGHAPPVLVLSLASIVGFVVSVVAAPQVADWPAWKQILLDLPILIGGLVVARGMAWPIGRVYKQSRED